MADRWEFTPRPAKSMRTDLKDAFRIYLSSSTLVSLKLRAGEPCQLELPGERFRTAIAWNAPENIQKTVLQASKTLQSVYDLKLTDKVFISRDPEPVRNVEIAFLRECTGPERIADYGEMSDTDKMHWMWFLEYPLNRAEYITPGLIFEDLDLKGRKRSFKVETVNCGGDATTQTLFRFTETSKIEIVSGDTTSAIDNLVSSLEIDSSHIGGMRTQIQQINECLEEFRPQLHNLKMPSWDQPSHGILIYGAKGTGKSLLLSKVATASWKKVFTIDSSVMDGTKGEGEKMLRRIFSDANRAQPSLIMVDELDRLAPKKGSSEGLTMAPLIREALDRISKQNTQVLLVATARHPSDVDETLRTSHRLETEIEISIPTAADRVEILKAIRGSSDQPVDAILEEIADRTHGYVGADLHALLRLASRKARVRHRQSLDACSPLMLDNVADGVELSQRGATPDAPVQREAISYEIEAEDVASALQGTRPTAMREVFLETPKVRWSDIGGQHDIKAQLQEAVELPLKYPSEMKRLNIQSTKGILLYGPAGCSKTMTVKALATEAGLNFLAVKGAEMISMYVGESERALREIFRKARAASPSIIFFDEIDAIASTRSDRGNQGSLNVLTTLLNEMDGIEELKNVLVVAATNKPDALDPALMRPGRLDFLLYVGPPDLEARKEILAIWFRKSDVGTEVELEELAQKADGYSGAEIISICGKAGRAAYRDGRVSGQKEKITSAHFDLAFSQVKKQITFGVINKYETWARTYGG